MMSRGIGDFSVGRIVLAAFAAMLAVPALAGPWVVEADTSVPNEDVFIAYQDGSMDGTQLFFSCYEPIQSVSLGVYMASPWLETLDYPSNVSLAFTIDGVVHEGRGFEFAEQGGMTVLTKYHADDRENFEEVFTALLAAQREIVVTYVGETVGFSAEGVDPAFRAVLSGCGIQ